MTIELTDRERDKLQFLVDEYRELIERRIREKQELIRRGHSNHPTMLLAEAKSEMSEVAELRALSEKLNK